ncbi:MAG TPA: hypothetical protein EYQ64_12905 [Gemmatimonadetes bacterium]|nr:hypothetical protein [Gemmatimonadota bacterium]
MESSGRIEALIGALVVFGLAGVVVAAPPFGAADGLFDPGQPRTLGLAKLTLNETVLYQATKKTYRFCHHPNLVRLGDAVWCMWSNGRVGEDEPGQRILVSKASVHDLAKWSEPSELAGDPTGRGACVAAGWVVDGPRLVALYTVTGGTNFDAGTSLWARRMESGGGWSPARRLLPGFFIAGPIRMNNGELLLAGEHVGTARAKGRMSLYRTPQPDGLSGWVACKIAPADLSVFGYTEPAPYVLADGVVVCPFRNYSGTLYASESRDGGRTWSVPAKTTFPDSLARHATGRLPGGDVFLINNSSFKRLDRSILTLALSSDGRRFDRAYVVKNQPTRMRFAGKHKLDGWQYPDAIVVGDELLVSFSVNKEDVRVVRIRLSDLGAKR